MNKTKFNWFMWQGVGASCWFMWAASTGLSYWGFVRLAPEAPWWVKTIAFGMSAAINFVEFMGDNFSWQEFWHPNYMRDYILRVFWVLCYAYDIYTNVLGFIGVVGIDVQTIAAAYTLNATMAFFATLFGVMAAIGPEPLYIYFLEKNFPYPGRNPFKAPKPYQKSVTPSQGYYQNLPKAKKDVQPMSLKEYLKKNYRENFNDEN